MAEARPRWAHAATLGAALACLYGVARAVQLRWVNDDAFISFRYARNLIRGHGLVYNVGERVEGFSNFLWTMMLAAGMRLGVEPVLLSEALGVLTFIALLALWFAFHLRFSRRVPEAQPLFPVAAAVIATTLHLQIYATSGLETGFYTFLISLAFTLTVCDERPRGQAAAGVAFALSAMTRPEGVLLYACVGVTAALLALRAPGPLRDRARPIIALAAPVFLIDLPFFFFRYAYYGWPLPNTFYAKFGGGGSHVSRGLHYLWVFAERFPVYLLAPLALALVLFAGSRLRRAGSASWLSAPDALTRRAAVLGAALLAAHLVFVLRVGGDFMFGRFVVPAIPILALTFELALRLVRTPAARLAAGGALPLLLVFFAHRYATGPTRFGQGIGEERAVYGPAELAEARWKGEALRGYLAGTDAKVVFYGTQAMLAYYADFPYALEGYGLTDVYVAHLPVKKVGRAGHEKQVPMDYIWRRGINFVFASGLMKLPPAEPYKALRLGGVDAQWMVYDRALAARLATTPGVTLTRFEDYLDDYLAALPKKPRAEVQTDYAAFKHYYFDKNPDPERQRPFEEHLRAP